ncbi:unnamed protein product [Closterium sp. NIES-53]
MEVARTSMYHAGAPQFLWPHAVRYAAHQLNLWPSDARPRVTPVSLKIGSPGVATDFHVWGSLAHVRAPGANKLSPRTRACVFLGFPLDAPGWVFYDLPPQVTPVAPSPSRPAPSGVSHVTPQSPPPQCPVPIVSRGAGGVVAEGEDTRAAGAGGVGSGGAGGVGVEFHPRSSLWPAAAEPGGVLPGGTGGPGGVVGGGAGSGEQRLLRLEREEREQFERAQQKQQQQQQEQSQSQSQQQERVEEESQQQLGQLQPQHETVEEESQVQQRVLLQSQLERVEEESQAHQERVEQESCLQQQVQLQTHQERVEESRSQQERGAQESWSQQRVQLQPQQERAEEEPQEQQQRQVLSQQTPEEAEQQRLRLHDLPNPAPTRLLCGPLPSPPVPPVQSLSSSKWTHGPFHLVLRSRAPPPPVLPQLPESSLIVFHDPLSDYLQASRLVVSRVLSALVTNPTTPLSSVSALVTTVAGFGSSHRLDCIAHLVSGPARSPFSRGAPIFPLEVLEDRQFNIGFLAAAVPHQCTMLHAPEGGQDALDIPIPCTHTEAVSGPWALYWIAAEEAEIASYRSTGTYVDAVPPPGVNVVSGIWLYKMTTLRVLLHIAAQCGYELHSLDFSTAFLQGSLHKQIWLPLDFFPLSANPSLFVRRGSTPVFVLVYVDNLVFATPGRRALASVKEELHRRHTYTDLGELQRYLSMQITRDRAARTTTLTQSHMVEQILTRFCFPFSKVQPDPLAMDHGLRAPPSDEPFESSGPYPELHPCMLCYA